MDRLKLRGIVLHTVDYGESDRVVTLLTRELGKVSAFARGARASRRRFGGALEPFTLLSAEARTRSASDLLLLESVAVVEAHGGIRGDLARIGCAAYAAELSRELVRDWEAHPRLFDLLLDYLALLDALPARPATLRAFEMGALKEAGLAPMLEACARCGATLPPAVRAFRFDPGQGGVLCPGCEPTAAKGAMRLSEMARSTLLRLRAGTLASAAAEPLLPPSGPGA